MKLQQIETDFRRLADDQVAPFLWSREEVVGYANAAEVDACERAHLIEDDSTPSVCRITVKAEKAVYTLSPLILKILRARLDSQSQPLKLTDRRGVEGLAWETGEGTPFALLENEREARLVWIPTADDVLYLAVKRLPKCEMSGAEDEPEIHPRHHIHLLDGMLARAYQKRDTETYNLEKSNAHEIRFTRAFGPRPDASVQRKRRASGLRVTRPGPYV